MKTIQVESAPDKITVFYDLTVVLHEIPDISNEAALDLAIAMRLPEDIVDQIIDGLIEIEEAEG